MRTLLKNRRSFFYANYQGAEPIKNADGQYTGEQRLVYTEPIRAKGSISASKGEAAVSMFGTEVDYDSVILLKETDMDENSILWIGITPDFPHNYVVRRVSHSLNHTAVAVREVDTGA